MTCLLDTCTFLWLTDQTEHLSPAARAVLEDGGNTLVLSQISALEIQLKHAKGKLSLMSSPEEFVTQSLERHSIQTLALADAHIWTIAKLPHIHPDPFDRLLVAQAIHEGMVLISPDHHIQSYPVRAIW